MDEEMNFGKRALLIVFIATVIVLLTTAIYVWVGEKPPVAVGQIVKLDVTPIHTEMRVGAGAQGVQGGMDTYDQLLVLAEVKVRNQTNIPLFLHDMWSNLITNNDDQDRSLAANRTDFESVFVAYPQMAQMKQEPLLRDTAIQPGQTAQGLVIFHYPMTKDQWDARHGFEAVVSFTHQKNLVLPWPPAK